MNEEQNVKINWLFNAVEFLLQNKFTDDEVYRNQLIDEADKIHLDYEVEETKLENKTKDALEKRE